MAWQEFENQEDMRSAARSTPPSTRDRAPFAFQMPNGRFRYVLASRELVGRVCLGLCSVPGRSGAYEFHRHGFEHLGGHRVPMILFANLKYSMPLNPDLDASVMLATMIKYIRRGFHELLLANGANVDEAQRLAPKIAIHVEMCHRPGEKVSFHLKVPSIVVRNMKAQQAFWLRVQALINEDIDETRMLTVNDQCGRRVSFLEMSAKEVFRLLGASKNKEGVLHFLVPEDRLVSSITLDEWLEALILRPHAKKGWRIPKEWFSL